jgi:membrane protease YdiL (CAAX protease family)
MRSEDRSIYYMSPPVRFFLLLGITAISLILGGLITFSIVAGYLQVSFAETQLALLDAKNAHIALFANAFASLIAFLVPSIAVAFFTNGSIAKNMGFKPISTIKLVYWVLLLSFVGLVLSGAAASLTEKIPVPAQFKAWATGLENTYKQAMLAMTKMNSIGDLIFNIIAVALIPAFVEELFFRGALQKTIKNWSGNVVMSIVITAIIFSAFHFSYFGFLSRMLLGILLGFIYEYSGSIWLSILMHFINNAIAIITLYTVRGNQVQVEKAMDESIPMYWGIFAIALVIYLLQQIKKDANYEGLDKNLLE